MRLWIMEMYRTSDNNLLGTYASHKIDFYGWRTNSSGVYVKRLGISFIPQAEWVPFPRFSADGPMVVALSPRNRRCAMT